MKTILIAAAFLLSTVALNAAEFQILFKGTDNISNKKICVFYEIEDLKQRSKVENLVMQGISKYGHVSGFSGMQMFPPARQWDDAKVASRLEQMQIDASLKIKYIPKDANGPSRIEASLTKVKEKHLQIVIGSPFEIDGKSQDEIDKFMKEWAPSLVSILFDEGYIYDCKCGEGYKNLIK